MPMLSVEIPGHGGSLRTHPHDTGWRRLPWALIQVVNAGPYRVRAEEGEIILAAGEGWILPPGLAHRIDAPTAGRQIVTRWAHLRCRLPEGVDLFSCWSFPRHLSRRSASGVDGVLRDLARLPMDDDVRSLARRQAASLALLEQLLDLGCADRPQPPRWAEVAPIMTAVRADPAAPWSRARLARMAGLSPTRFHEVFRAVAGEAPMTWVRRVRVDSAKELLLAGEVTVARIAEQVGFEDPYHFARVFRHLEGMSPGRWRRRPRA